jgi:hypothetical protein
MGSEITIQQIEARLAAVENKVRELQDRWANGQSLVNGDKEGASHSVNDLFSDKTDLMQAMDDLMARLGITGGPVISPEELQKKMRAAGISGNEFSEGIIAMREE